MTPQMNGTVALVGVLCLLFAVSDTLAGPNEVLILEPSVTSPASNSREYHWVQQLGFTPVVVNSATWSSMSTAQFSDYEAIVLGDPNCQTDTNVILAAYQNQATWNKAVDGNVILIGTDPALHYTQGGDTLIKYGIAYATEDAGSGITGAFVTLSCYYNNTTPLQVTMLDSISSQGTFSTYTSQCHNLVHIVASHPALTNLTDNILSNWSCSTHDVFDDWPDDFIVLAIGRNLGSYQAVDGTIGQPYILARGDGLHSTDCVNAPPGIVNWWRLDEATGPTAADIRGSANDGAHAGVTPTSSGKVQGGLVFDGVNDFVEVPDDPEVNFGASLGGGQGDFSIDAWIKTTDSTGIAALVDKMDATSSVGYSLLLENGMLGLEIADGTVSSYTSGVFVADDEWHFVAVAVDRDSPTGITFYVDGSPVATADPTGRNGTLTNSLPLYLGARTPSGGDYFGGTLDEVEMFDQALTDFDLFTVYFADSLGKCSLDIVAGACCTQLYGCILTLDEVECDSLNGYYLGDGSVCNDSICQDSALGACCLPDGSCVDSVTSSYCIDSLQGLYMGHGETCDSVECRPQGACCAPDGPGTGGGSDTCIMTMGEQDCLNLGGTYYGDFTSCDTIPCDTCTCVATGDVNGDGLTLTTADYDALFAFVNGFGDLPDSACFADLNGDCVIDQADLDLFQCYFTYGLSCFTSYGGYPVTTCCDPTTVTGACCVDDTCYQYAAQNCVEGTYQGDNQSCDTISCQPDTVVVVIWDDIPIIKVPPIEADTVGDIVIIGPFDPGPGGIIIGMTDSIITGWNGKWQELEQPGTILPHGAFIQVKAYQQMSGAAEQSIGTGRAQKIGTKWRLEADFMSIGAETHSVQVFHNDLLIATLQEHSGPAGYAAKPPDDWHWKTHAPGARIQHGCTGTWGVPVEFELDEPTRDGVHHVMADSIKFVPENQSVQTDYLSKVVFSAGGIPSITFTDMSLESESCCENRGNVDGVIGAAGAIDVADLSYLVDYLFRGGPAPPCLDEGNVDGSTGAAGPIDVADLSYIVDFLFRGGPAPPGC